LVIFLIQIGLKSSLKAEQTNSNKKSSKSFNCLNSKGERVAIGSECENAGVICFPNDCPEGSTRQKPNEPPPVEDPPN
jgi:hypothetical protein